MKRILVFFIALCAIVALSGCDQLLTLDTGFLTSTEDSTTVDGSTTTNDGSTIETTTTLSDEDQLRARLTELFSSDSELTVLEVETIVDNVITIINNNSVAHADALEMINDVDDLVIYVNTITDGLEDDEKQDAIMANMANILADLIVVTDNAITSQQMTLVAIDVLDYMASFYGTEETPPAVTQILNLLSLCGTNGESAIAAVVRVIRTALSADLTALMTQITSIIANSSLTEMEVNLAVADLIAYYNSLKLTSTELDSAFTCMSLIANALLSEAITNEIITTTEISNALTALRSLVETNMNMVNDYIGIIDLAFVNALKELSEGPSNVAFVENALYVVQEIANFVVTQYSVITSIQEDQITILANIKNAILEISGGSDLQGPIVDAFLSTDIYNQATLLFLDLVTSAILSEDLTAALINELMADMSALETTKETEIASYDAQYDLGLITQEQYDNYVEDSEDTYNRLSSFTLIGAVQGVLKDAMASLSDTELDALFASFSVIIPSLYRLIQIEMTMGNIKNDVEDIFDLMCDIMIAESLTSLTYADAKTVNSGAYASWFDHIEITVNPETAILVSYNAMHYTYVLTLTDLVVDGYNVDSEFIVDPWIDNEVTVEFTSSVTEPDLTTINAIVTDELIDEAGAVYALLQVLANANDIDLLAMDLMMGNISSIVDETEAEYERVRAINNFFYEALLFDTDADTRMGTLLTELFDNVLSNPDLVSILGLPVGFFDDLAVIVEDMYLGSAEIYALPEYALASPEDILAAQAFSDDIESLLSYFEK